MVLHLLGGGVHRHQPLGPIRLVHKGIDVRVCDVPLPVEERRLPEDNILLVKLVLALYKSDPLKPDQVHITGAIGEVGHQTPPAPLAKGLEGGDPPFQLDVSLCAVDLMHVVDARAVDVTVWIPAKEVTQSKEIDLLVEDLCPFGSHAGDKFYVGLQDIHRRLPGLLPVGCKCIKKGEQFNHSPAFRVH